MAVYVMGDLHLSQAVNKPMDLFGGVWNGYVEKIQAAWTNTITPEDTVLLAGDTSWGMSLAEALLDFQLIEQLPGRKLLLKGNHDYFWTTVTGMRRFLAEHQLNTLDFLHNSAVQIGEIAYCGTRGWFVENENAGAAESGKVYRRELIRLKASLEEGRKLGAPELVAVLHYPPVFQTFVSTGILELLHTYGVRRCYYGHLHGRSLRYAKEGCIDGITYTCISADHLNFSPLRID